MKNKEVREVLLKDIDDGSILGVITVPRTVTLEQAEDIVYDLRDKWYDESDETLIEYLENHIPTDWGFYIPSPDDREVIEI